MLEKLKQEVYKANMLLPQYGLVTFTWGNASGIDREKKLFVIKPSGVDYENLTPEIMVVLDLDGNVVEGELNPSSDTETHLVLYRQFPEIGGIVHTHSPWATSWAQAGRNIPCYGTTHADYIYGDVPCIRNLTTAEIDEGYERNTGNTITEYFNGRITEWGQEKYLAVPCVLCKNHGPFAWGKTAGEAVHNAVVLEEVARMAAQTEWINRTVSEAPQELQDKHYLRKHGPDAYYGQKIQTCSDSKYRYDAVIFDLDGVICHTDAYHYLAWKTLADRLGIPFDAKVNNLLRGVSREESLEIILKRGGLTLTEEDKRCACVEKNEIYKALLDQMSPADLSDGVKDTLDALRSMGIKLAIGSSSKNAKKILKRIGLEYYFDAVSDGTAITRSKPDPEVFLHAARYIGISPDHCLVVEDARAGIEAARRAGMDSAGIGDAAQCGEAVYQIDYFAQLIDICKI